MGVWHHFAFKHCVILFQEHRNLFSFHFETDASKCGECIFIKVLLICCALSNLLWHMLKELNA